MDIATVISPLVAYCNYHYSHYDVGLIRARSDRIQMTDFVLNLWLMLASLILKAYPYMVHLALMHRYWLISANISL